MADEKYMLLLELQNVTKDEAVLMGHAIIEDFAIGSRCSEVTLIAGLDMHQISLDRLSAPTTGEDRPTCGPGGCDAWLEIDGSEGYCTEPAGHVGVHALAGVEWIT